MASFVGMPLLYLSILFCVLLKAIQNGLPTVSLHIYRMLTFSIKCFHNFCSVALRLKSDTYFSSVRHCIGNQLVVFHFVVHAFKIETPASVFGFHTRLEFTAGSDVVLGPWG